MRIARVLGFALLAGCSGPDAATVCHDALVAAGDLETKAAPCSIRVQRITDGATFCSTVKRCSPEGLKQWTKYTECLLDLQQCQVSTKTSWESKLTACGAYAPTECPSDSGAPPP